MIKHETEIPAAAVWPHVGERLRLGVPLGAYALDHRVRYLFLEERGVQVLSAHTERGQLVEAVSPYLPGLQCDEQEMADESGTKRGLARLSCVLGIRSHSGIPTTESPTQIVVQDLRPRL
jgi:hypothetical protein